MYSNVSESIEKMDEEIEVLLEKLTHSNPEAMSELKRVFWSGTEDWETLLVERAEISGRLVLSDFTRNAIQAFKKK